MSGSEFAFDIVDLLYYKLHKISLNRGRSYIDSPKQSKNKKAAINSKNNDDKCFQYAVNVALNYKALEKILNEHKKLSLLFTNIIDLINFLSHKKDREKFESNNTPIALNILYVPYNTKE